MALFRRNRTPAHADPAVQARATAEFWRWWEAEGAAGISQAIEDRTPETWNDGLSERVAAVHPDLQWELGPGSLSQHTLVVTSGGVPDLRAVARRWLLAAPDADPTWSYADQRLPNPGWIIEIHGHRVDPAAAVATARVAGPGRVDVVVHHPSFEALSETQRLQVTYLLLDGELGEAAVETWVGEVAPATHAPLDAYPLSGLASVVRDVERDSTDEDGQPSWVLLRGETPTGDPVLASAQVPLRAVTAPHLTTYLGVLVGYAERTEKGLPAGDSLANLRALEDRLRDGLGTLRGAVVAHETKRGARLLHVYVDPTTDAVAEVQRLLADWDGPVDVSAQPDAGWDAVRHLRA